jgi:hypothetical protein
LAEAVIGVQEVPELALTSAKAKANRRRSNGTEATHWLLSAVDPSMVLLNADVEMLAVLVADIRTKLASNRAQELSGPSAVTGAGVMPLIALADRRNCSAAAISWVSLGVTSTNPQGAGYRIALPRARWVTRPWPR